MWAAETMPDLPTVNVGLLGADFELDAASGMYRFKKIYPGENWDAQLRSPLTEPGVKREGRRLSAGDQRTRAACAGRLPMNCWSTPRTTT